MKAKLLLSVKFSSTSHVKSTNSLLLKFNHLLMDKRKKLNQVKLQPKSNSKRKPKSNLYMTWKLVKQSQERSITAGQEKENKLSLKLLEKMMNQMKKMTSEPFEKPFIKCFSEL